MNTAKDSKACLSTMKLIGDYWILSIIFELKREDMRFCELQRSLGNVNPVTLTKRLKKLEDAALINRTEDDKQAVTYSLTGAGRRYLPIIDAIQNVAS